MEITITETWTSSSLCWHYQDIFWGGARQRLQDFAKNHELDEMESLFDSIIEYSTCGETEQTINITQLNDIIWFDWEEILQFANIEE